ncbi:MAG: PA14 domain-containing protein [Patescibacteria group bacterium]|nr:PA14 domain-containing protein [Patescibacteria group bacterium]
MKKVVLITLLVVSALFLGGADFVYAQSSAYSAGDLIKTRDRSTVYYFGYDGKRHAFPNEPTYFSWYSNFDGIKIVTPQELAEIQLGHNIVVRPGTHMIKIQSDPKVYAVEPYGVLRHIQTESAASFLYGPDWAERILDINVAFFPDYLIREPLSYGTYPEGTVFRYAGEYPTYILRNNYLWQFKNLAQAESHRYQQRFILEISQASMSTPSGDKEISEIHPILIDAAQTLTDSYDTFFVYGSTYPYTEPPSTQPPSTQPPYVEPPAPIEPPFDTSTYGLMGYYYSGTNFNTQQAVRIDPVVNFAWGDGSPIGPLASDNFSVKWVGKIRIDESREYEFHTWSDDGVRLYVNGNLIINNWKDHMTIWDKGRIYLPEGYHDIRLEYYERIGGAYIKLCWDSRENVIPSSQMHPVTSYYISD